MNVASKELCQELYELSGWKGELPVHTVGAKVFPAYQLGYLLSKLNGFLPTVHQNEHQRWVAYSTPRPGVYEDDTPEDAAAKLAIELFKQGILMK